MRPPCHSRFSRLSARSQVTCTSLLSFASHRSILLSVAAYSSHRFLLNTKLTTGSNVAFLRCPMRWVQTFWSSWKDGRLGPNPPPAPPRPPRPPPGPPPRDAAPGAGEGAPCPPPRLEWFRPAPILVNGAERPVGSSRALVTGAPPRPPVRWTGGSPAASRSLSCFRRMDSTADLYLQRVDQVSYTRFLRGTQQENQVASSPLIAPLALRVDDPV
jgi:hypothetical protein